MADTGNFGFGKLVPGFDFLQNLAKGASQSLPQMPNLSNWIAPTLNVEDLEKRIDELKTVQFWLEQNSKALGATIQALEVQKMTLSTLQGMNFSVGELAQGLQLKADAIKAAAVPAAASATAFAADPPKAADKPKAPKRKTAARKTAANPAPAAAANGVVDPMQWWGALSQQFQQIASNAMKEAATQTAADATRNMASGLAKEALKTATGTAKAMAKTMGGAATTAATTAVQAAAGAASKAGKAKAGSAKRARR